MAWWPTLLCEERHTEVLPESDGARLRDHHPPRPRAPVVKVVWLERIVIGVASLALAAVLIALLSGYFTGQDDAMVSSAGGVGLKFADQGNEQLAPGSRRPSYDSEPPTSGPHVPVAVTADRRVLSNDQILSALAAGNVVIVYGSPAPPPALVSLSRSLAEPFSPALVRAGLAVILARRPGAQGLIALAWTRMLRQSALSPDTLTTFVQSWLGHGAAG